MASSKLTRKGQATIPVEVRRHLSLGPGDAIEFVLLDNGTVVVRPAYIDVMDLEGALVPRKGKRLTIDQINDVVRRRAKDNDAGR